MHNIDKTERDIVENKSIFNSELIVSKEEREETYHINTVVKLNTIDDTLTYESSIVKNFSNQEERETLFIGTYRDCFLKIHKIMN